MKKDADEQQWAKAKKRNARNRNGSKGESMSDIDQLIADKKWEKARALIQEELISAPADHWLWMHLGLTYYEEKSYEQAAACSKRAVELRPNCPLALWHYAGSLFMNGNEQGVDHLDHPFGHGPGRDRLRGMRRGHGLGPSAGQ
jgi:predicted Zn-dependent protease